MDPDRFDFVLSLIVYINVSRRSIFNLNMLMQFLFSKSKILLVCKWYEHGCLIGICRSDRHATCTDYHAIDVAAGNDDCAVSGTSYYVQDFQSEL